MRFRIVTNGLLFRVQWKRAIGWVTRRDGYGNVMNFATKEQAVNEAHEWAERRRQWKAKNRPFRLVVAEFSL